MHRLKHSTEQIRELIQIADIGEIARRYFAMNAFDGILTIIGVLMGNYTAGVRQASVVVTTGLATCTAMGVSGLWGAYLTESAERQRKLDVLEQQTLSDLSTSKIGRAAKLAPVIVALVDGIAPFAGALLVLAPFFLNRMFADITTAYYVSLGVAMVTLFALGAFLGRVGKTSLILSGVKMIGAGVTAIVLAYLLEAV